MIDTSKEWVLCAAIWYKDGTEAPRGFIAQNISSGVVIGQWRHGNIVNIRATNKIWNKRKLEERLNRADDDVPMRISDEKPDVDYDYVDGFITSKGNFVDRWQGMKLAYEAGQVDKQRAFKPLERLHDEAISDEELMNSEPQYRTGKMCGQYNMMYSEDLY